MEHAPTMREYHDTKHDVVRALRHLAEHHYMRDQIPVVVEDDLNYRALFRWSGRLTLRVKLQASNKVFCRVAPGCAGALLLP